MDDLFEQENTGTISPDGNDNDAMPLAARMRPQCLDDFAGQQHILGKDFFLQIELIYIFLHQVLAFHKLGFGGQF